MVNSLVSGSSSRFGEDTELMGDAVVLNFDSLEVKKSQELELNH